MPPASSRDFARRVHNVTAVLGPTNTGKTHLAIDRMLAHSSGLIGLPLRLLAREVYQRCVARAGAENVALITGEERIKPPNPRYWVSTVEAMPDDLDVAFVAIDEVQLASDFERGHLFTDRILNRRGREETWLLGAATMRGILGKVLPGLDVVQRPRLSMLTHAGDKKITRLPRRSAVVAFSADEVYAIAELIRRQSGGAAVVLGALSPRTRNAQVALFQAGDVDYLVATDAIGMGLNLDVDHVAFNSDRKFDGFQFRQLSAAEMAQIAGRAGRAQRDGTFGTTGKCAPFAPELIERLETHTFEPVKMLQWRNAALDFSSLRALDASLAEIPQQEGLTRAPLAGDVMVLERAARDPEIADMAQSKDAIRRLWSVCQIPDYRKVAPAAHSELVFTLYGFLMREGTIPADWIAEQVALADRPEGDIDTLSNRIAQVRTWTFVANRPDWLREPEHWQGVTRAVEDRLSDALHERLAQRFVDRRTSVLMRRLRENTRLEAEINQSGEVIVEGHMIGRLQGFEFAPDASGGGPDAKALRAAAQKALAGAIEQRASEIDAASDDSIILANDGVLRWKGEPVAKLAAGDTALNPRVQLIADEHLTGPARDKVAARLERWLAAHIEKLLGPLNALTKAEDVTGMARGVAFQLVEALGVLDRTNVADEVKGLDQEARGALRKYGMRFGAYHIYIPALLKPAPRQLALLLWALKHGGLSQKGMSELPALAASGRTSIPNDREIQKSLYRAAGYRVSGTRSVRVDILERLADLIRPAIAWKPGAPGEKPAGAIDGFGFTVAVGMTSLVGCSGEDFAAVLRSLGYRMDRRPAPVEAKPEDAKPEETKTEEAKADETPATEPAAEVAQPLEAAAPTEASTTSNDTTETQIAPEATASAEPAMIEVWRPGRPRPERKPERKRPPRKEEAKTADGAPAEAAAASPASERPRHDRRDKRGKDRNKDRGKRGDGNAASFKPRPERKEKPIDPNSPFASLLALKERLVADKKDKA
ncbi:MAG TPA: helicase-related protein [Xanthobacteraceae bacterium]|nr:helicase-related protein [Xanthobacteraceae bacterium]